MHFYEILPEIPTRLKHHGVANVSSRWAPATLMHRLRVRPNALQPAECQPSSLNAIPPGYVVKEIHIKTRGRRLGVSLSGHNRAPMVVNVARDGLARGRLRFRDRITAINHVFVTDEETANRLLRGAVDLHLRILRPESPRTDEDDDTELSSSESDGEEDDHNGHGLEASGTTQLPFDSVGWAHEGTP